MRRRKRRILAAGMVVVITCSSYGSVPRVYANTNFYQIREIESLSEQVLYQKVPYGTRYQDLEMPDSIDVFVSGGGQTGDVPDAGSDENVAAFANRINDDAVLEKMDSEENGEKEDTEGKDTEGKDAGENSKDKSEGGEGLEKAESGSGEQGDSGKDGNSAENGDSQDENANPGNGESDEKDDSGKTDSGSSGGNTDLNEDGSYSNGKTDESKEDVKTDEKTEEEIDKKEGFWRKVKVRWVLDAEESQASRYDGENPGIYLFRAELKSSNYEVDEDELPVIQITVLEEEQAKTTLEFAPLEESITDQILPLGSKESDIRFPETLTVRETTGEETTERTLSGITWKLDAENSDYSEFQGGLAPEDYFDRFDEDGEPEETEEKTWEGYDKANEEYNGAIYTYIPVIPESEEIPEDTALPEIHVQVGDAGIALYSGRIEGQGTEEDPWQIKNEEDWKTITTSRRYCNSGNLQGCIRLEGNIDFSQIKEESRKIPLKLNGKTYASGASYTMPEGNVTFKAVWVQDQWDGQAVVEPAKDENGYYQISTGAELAYFRDTKISNWKAKLMCDIDMGGHDFASIPKAGAEFDGCGHTIRGLNAVGKAYVGLFQAISSKCEIKNLTIENAVVRASNDDARVGILVGDVYDSLTVENCYVSGTIETTDGTNKIESAGGLIGNVREYSNYSVNIKSCYADAEIKGTASKRFVGGLVGWTGGSTTIDNSYAVVDMNVEEGQCIGGLVGCGSDSKVKISHSYAAGEALTKSSTGAAVAGISNNGSISSCVSIFPEMRSLNRIGGTSGEYTNNYGFAGTVARKSDGTILTPDPNMMGADKLYGADATEANLKDPEFYKGLGWNFDSTWTMDSTGGYAFPILKNQTLRPNLTLDLTPLVTGIKLDKTSETIYPRGSVQLTATVDVANGASREVTWKSSDPAVKVEDGLVTAAAAANGTYTITAISKADPSKQAVCQLTVDTAEHMVTVGREPGHTNSLNAVVKAYASLNDAKGGTNPISTTGSETGTFTFSQKAGEIVYLAFTGLDSEDVVSKVTITDANGSKVDATLCNFEDPTVYYFTMPCSNASVQVSYAVNLNATQYTWFVGQEWGTWGTTAAFETKEWSGGDHIGSLKVTKIINGKLFREFKIKSMSLYKKDSVIPKKVNSQSELTENGNYCIEKDNTTGLPTLYVYLEGPGMVAVDIEVQDNPNAEFSITKKPGSSSYYMLNRTTAKVGDLVTATLTAEGVRRMKEMQNKNACLTYSGGLLVVIYPPKFTESGGKWTASFNMPAQNIETNVYFGEKDKVTLKGTDKEVDYDGAPKSVEDGIRATIGGQDLSEQFQGQYEVYYEGVNGTVYSSKTPPTNAGTYSCTVKLPDSNVYYMSNPITVQLTIKKIATKTPKAAQAAAWTDTSVTLEAPSAFVDGTAIPAGYELEYCVDQGEWQDSPVFTGLTPETTYNFYVRLKEGVNTTASAASEAVTVQTKKASSDPSNPTKPNPSNPNPSTPGNPQGTTTSGRDRSTSTWVKESTGWRYRLSNGTYLSGSLVLDPATGRQVEQVVWKQLRGAWWAFGADGYIRTGWVYDYSAGEWYYVDENTGMRTGWYLDPQDGRWYYLDPATGEMLTEWQLIPDLGYVYLNPYAPQPTWAYDEELKTWVYMEGAGRPYGSLYMAEWTPDGYYVNADGVWEPAR